jgi:hypothetical protein
LLKVLLLKLQKKQVQMLLDLMTLLKAFKVEILISTWLLLLLMQCALLVS